ncbi:hypothetical protein TSOC_005633 [Tetrabaena socialis]|uniref:Uncharacterized protein n=1 Tax=Tetrabaena socialis TaxID=47790 RepID=A0A2J8A5S8_9CHLO|nr:hypothetical protein TSOC_005633 [Tetrabaena socialis]|eukprot:PNH07853.1 hypothetical protein TSOC_005633 [Tetrabaena socialis]
MPSTLAPSLDYSGRSCLPVAPSCPSGLVAASASHPPFHHQQHNLQQQQLQQQPFPPQLLTRLLQQDPALLLLHLQQEQQTQLQRQQQQQHFPQQQQLQPLYLGGFSAASEGRLGSQAWSGPQQQQPQQQAGGLPISQPTLTAGVSQPLHHLSTQQQLCTLACAPQLQEPHAAQSGLRHHAVAPATFTLHMQMMSLPQLQVHMPAAPLALPLPLPISQLQAVQPPLQAPLWRGSCAGGGAEDWILHVLGVLSHPDATRLALHCWRRVEGLPQLHHATRIWPTADAGRRLYATACLWIAAKLEVKRCEAPGGAVLAAMAAATPAALGSGELAVMNWLGWRPYEGYRLDDSHLLVFM